MKDLLLHKNIYGILGTIIVHLVLIIFFMLIRLSVDYKNMDHSIEIDLSPYLEQSSLELPATKVNNEKSFMSESDLHDIAINISSTPEAKFDIDKYIDQIKEEMIQKGELDKDNFIDQRKEKARKEAESGNLQYINAEDPTKKAEQDKDLSSVKMATNYTGPTRIYYNLSGRSHIKLPLPVYKCPVGGKVTLEILVNQYGTVISAEVLKSESTTDDFCLYEAARKAAMQSRFNSGNGFVEKQKGTITYLFASQ